MYCLFLVLLSLWVGISEGHSAWDCSLHGKKVETYNAADVARCTEFGRSYHPMKNTTVQIVQSHESFKTTVLQCSVFVSTSVTRCGFNSLTYGQEWVYWEKPIYLDAATCRQMWKQSSYTVGLNQHKIVRNSTSTFVVVEHGAVNSNGDCEGASFTLDGRAYSKSYMQNTYKVWMSEQLGTVFLATNEIRLPNALRSHFTDGSAFSMEHGFMLWNTTVPKCTDVYTTMYLGSAAYAEAISDGKAKDMLLVMDTSSRKYGGFYLGSSAPICQFQFRKTQVPGIFVKIDIDLNHPYTLGNPMDPRFNPSLQLSSLVSQGLISESLKREEAFEDIHNYICESDRQHLRTLLLNARLSPDGGFLIHRGLEGVRVVPAGQVLHLIPCRSVAVGKAEVEYCTSELPVRYNQTTKFIDPITKILKAVGTRIPCDPVTPACWEITGEWYCGYPEIRLSQAPRLLEPRDPGINRDLNLADFEGQGWYTEQEVAAFERKMVFEDTRPAIPSDFAAAAVMKGEPLGKYMDSISRGLESDFSKIADEVAHPLTSWMGSWKTSFYILIAVIPASITLIAIGLRCVGLYSARGFGCHLMGAINETLSLVVLVPFRMIGRVKARLTELFSLAVEEDASRPGSHSRGPQGRNQYLEALKTGSGSEPEAEESRLNDSA